MYCFAVLVETGGQSDRIGELQIEQIGLQIWIVDLAALEIRTDTEFGALDRCLGGLSAISSQAEQLELSVR